MDDIDLKEHLTTELHFTDFLIQKGVSKEAIESSKTDIISSSGDLEIYCDEVEILKDVLVPVKHVKKPTRQGNIGLSWYNIVDYAFNGVPTNIKVNMASKRIWQLMVRNFVNEYEDFEKWNKLFSTKESKMANFDFYKYDFGSDSEPFYYQAGGNGGGTHRMVLAKVTGVEKIHANEVRVFKVNPRKKHSYDRVKDKKKLITNFIEGSNWLEFTMLKDIILSMPNTSNNQLILGEVFNYFDVSQLDNYEYVSSYIKDLDKMYSLLKELDKSLNQNMNFYNLLPTSLLGFLCEQSRIILLKNIIDNGFGDEKKELLRNIKIHQAYNYKCK